MQNTQPESSYIRLLRALHHRRRRMVVPPPPSDSLAYRALMLAGEVIPTYRHYVTASGQVESIPAR